MLRNSSPRGADVRLFGPFRLDVLDQRLWKGTQESKLRRKPFAILRYLTAHPRRLVTQEELVEAVWGKIAMSESLLRTHVSELRRVLGEDTIETVVGRGYRFLLDVEAEKAAPLTKSNDGGAPPSRLVGRTTEMTALRDAFDRVLQAKRQLVFVTGEPGIGKTGLVDAFVAQIAVPHGALVASGSCVEQFGAGEAYLPALAAIGAVCRGPDGERVVEVLARHAPTWLAQMPGLVQEDALQSVLLRVQGATQARMLRELAEALEVLSAESPIVLVLEDMQWSDHATADLIAMLGARREAARVFVIATCRPTELVKGEGLAKTIAQLTAHKQAFTLPLETWSERAVLDYLELRFPNARFPNDLAHTLHDMAGGNPLFTSATVDDLESRAMIRDVDGHWQLGASTSEVAKRRPDTVRQLIDIQIDRVTPGEQRILEAAAIVGSAFTAGAVAYALTVPSDEVDSTCEALANDGRFLRFVTTEAWPDGTIQAQYSFVHALYRDAALARIPSATKRTWHRRVAEGLETSHGEGKEAIAAELAIHFEEAQTLGKAVDYYCIAGERATRRFGRADALAQFTRAQALVGRLPASSESERIELRVLEHAGPAIIGLRGFLDPALERTFARTAELARKLGDDQSLFGALLGLQRCRFLEGDLRKVEQHEDEVSKVVSRLGDPVAAAEAAVLAFSARLFRGQIAVARRPLTDACLVLDAAEADARRVANAPVVGLSAGHLVVLEWLSGAPDEAMNVAGRMLVRAEALGDPFHLSTALTITALAHMWRRESQKTLETAGRALSVARDVGSLVWEGRANALYRWAAMSLDPTAVASHYEALSAGMSEWLGAGPYGRTAFTPCIALVFARAGHVDQALRELDDALRFVEASDERLWSAELHRLRGELLEESDAAEAERAMTSAIEIAASQGARSFELRAAISLAKFHRGKKRPPALKELGRIHAAFSEGLETGDLVEAKALLDERR